MNLFGNGLHILNVNDMLMHWNIFSCTYTGNNSDLVNYGLVVNISDENKLNVNMGFIPEKENFYQICTYY